MQEKIKRMQEVARRLGEELLGRPVPLMGRSTPDGGTFIEMGVSTTASAPDSDSGNVGSNPAPPANSEKDGCALEPDRPGLCYSCADLGWCVGWNR